MLQLSSRTHDRPAIKSEHFLIHPFDFFSRKKKKDACPRFPDALAPVIAALIVMGSNPFLSVRRLSCFVFARVQNHSVSASVATQFFSFFCIIFSLSINHVRYYKQKCLPSNREYTEGVYTFLERFWYRLIKI